MEGTDTMSRIARDAAEQLVALQGGWVPKHYDVHPRIPEERIAVISDAHIPYHDEWLLADAFERGALTGLQAVVFLGDLMDMPTQSHYGNDDPTTYLERELQMTEGVLRLAAQFFPKVYWSSGNHEDRLLHKLGKQIGLERMAGLVHVQDLIDSGKLVVSDDPTWWYHNDEWMLTHPGAYGSKPLEVPGAIADVHQKHIVSAHAHHFAMGKSPSGKFKVIESGGAFHPGRIAYVNRRVTAHRKWVQGYVTLVHGEPCLHE